MPIGAGDEVICASAVYGGTLHLLQDLLSQFGVVTRFASLEEFARIDTDGDGLISLEEAVKADAWFRNRQKEAGR